MEITRCDRTNALVRVGANKLKITEIKTEIRTDAQLREGLIGGRNNLFSQAISQKDSTQNRATTRLILLSIKASKLSEQP